jgi:broad specificity phosphatase PhoE
MCEFLKNFKDTAPYITHILTSPLSRCLDTVIYALKDVTQRGIIVFPMAELQTLDSGPNGIGLSVSELKDRYGTTGESSPGSLEEDKIAEYKP